MSSKPCLKVAVTGAAGQIGYALLFRVASGQMFGLDYEIELQLLELEGARKLLDATAMELDDCAFPLLRKIVCTSELKTAMDGVNWGLLVGAVPRKEGMERSDLLQINGKIFTAQGKAINDYAAKDVKVFVIGNPCNTNCLITMHSAPDVPKDRFYAMSMLDENRAKSQLAIKAGAFVKDVSQIAIWGNHSPTQYPDFYNAKINSKPAPDVINDEKWLQNEFIDIVQKRGAAVIKARGSSSAASAANAVVDGVYALTHATVPNDFYSMCLHSNGEYDIDPGLIFSFPCVTKNKEVKVVTGLTHNDFAKKKLQITLDELRSEMQMVKELGLIK